MISNCYCYLILSILPITLLYYCRQQNTIFNNQWWNISKGWYNIRKIQFKLYEGGKDRPMFKKSAPEI